MARYEFRVVSSCFLLFVIVCGVGCVMVDPELVARRNSILAKAQQNPPRKYDFVDREAGIRSITVYFAATDTTNWYADPFPRMTPEALERILRGMKRFKHESRIRGVVKYVIETLERHAEDISAANYNHLFVAPTGMAQWNMRISGGFVDGKDVLLFKMPEAGGAAFARLLFRSQTKEVYYVFDLDGNLLKKMGVYHHVDTGGSSGGMRKKDR